MHKAERSAAIEASEGRLIIQELSLFGQSQLLPPLSDAEVACAFGADMLLNAFDCNHPLIPGIACAPQQVIQTLKAYTGRLIGVDLEPLGHQTLLSEQTKIAKGRTAAVDNTEITIALKKLKEVVGDELILMAG